MAATVKSRSLPRLPVTSGPALLVILGTVVLVAAAVEVGLVRYPHDPGTPTWFALAVAASCGLVVRYQQSLPRYTLPNPIPVAVAAVFALHPDGTAVLAAGLAVAIGYSGRAIRNKDWFTATVPVAVASLGVFTVVMAAYLLGPVAGLVQRGAPGYLLLFAGGLLLYTVGDVRIGYLLSRHWRTGRAVQPRITDYLNHALASAASLAVVVLVMLYYWDENVLSLAPMVLAVTLPVVIALREPRLLEDDDGSADVAMRAFTAALYDLAEARTVTQVAEVVLSDYPRVFAAGSAHLSVADGRQFGTLTPGTEVGHVRFDLSHEDQHLGVLTIQGLDPYAYSDLHLPAAELLAKSLARVRELAQAEEFLRDAGQKMNELEDQMELGKRLNAAAQHEIGNPLAVIDGYLGLFRMNVFGTLPEDVTEPLEAIGAASKRIRMVSQSLLMLAAAGQGTLEPSLEILGVKTALQSMRFEYAKMFPGYQIEVAEGSGYLEVDPQWFRQIVDNLVSNAVKASEPGSTIKVSTDRADGWFSIRVQDQGMGIKPEDLEHVQQAFYRSDEARALRIPGTGMGLYVVSELARLHHARVEIASTLGEGTTVTVSFKDEVD